MLFGFVLFCGLRTSGQQTALGAFIHALAAQSETQLPQATPPGKTQVSQSSRNEAYPLILVEHNGRFGFIDNTGKTVIRFRYRGARKFSEGLAPVKLGRKLGYIDETGKMVIPPQYSDAGEFSEGLARVLLGKKWGYIDKTGKMAIAPQFCRAEDFSDGLAAFALPAAGMPRCEWGYIDKGGQVAISHAWQFR